MNNLNITPLDLPVPQDDGAARHLPGSSMPDIELLSSRGGKVNLAAIAGYVVVFCYPMTGRPEVALPTGWDQIPGARGCTPQNCSYRDHYHELQALKVEVFGLSVQDTDYQQEMASRLHLPYAVLSDSNFEFQRALKLPVFEAAGMTLLKRLTLIVKDGMVEAIHYPVFPSDSDPLWVMAYLNNKVQQ